MVSRKIFVKTFFVKIKKLLQINFDENGLKTKVLEIKFHENFFSGKRFWPGKYFSRNFFPRKLFFRENVFKRPNKFQKNLKNIFRQKLLPKAPKPLGS